MRGMDSASVDAVVTDPPAGINFMQRAFDSDRGGRTQWVAWLAERMAEAARVIKPGHYALVWALPRTSHWTACALEDAGWTLVERIAHVFGQGFPKSKARLKPAVEDWWLCRAPGGGKVRELNVDACRVAAANGRPLREPGHRSGFGDVGVSAGSRAIGETSLGRWPANLVLTHSAACRPAGMRKVKGSHDTNPPEVAERRENREDWRMPARTKSYVSPDGTETIEAWLCSDDCPVRQLDEQGREQGSHGAGHARPEPGGGSYTGEGRAVYGGGIGVGLKGFRYGDGGSNISRFFPTFAWSEADFFPLRYIAKASRSERNSGLAGNGKVRLRQDLTQEQREHVLAQLRLAGVET